MGHFLFFLFAVVAGLLWTAACTAGAARVTRPRLKSLLAALGTALPVIAVLPVVAATWWLAFVQRLPTNWFPPAITMLVALLIGGGWIVRAGLVPPAGGEAPAGRWPLVGLTALSLLAMAVTAGVLLILDNAVVAQAAYLRLEAANLVHSNLPPVAPEGENAAVLHMQAGAAIAADTAFNAEGSPIDGQGDASRDGVTGFLARHAATLDVIRRAADRDACRFARDWTRPSIDMQLPEIQGLRNEARLLALGSRRAAVEGRHADALADIVRIHRLGRHAATEPILISALVGMAIDRMALQELVGLLPRLGAGDAPLLDSSAVVDLLARPFDLAPALRGEEAFGLATFAGFADGRTSMKELVASAGMEGTVPAVDTGPIFRVFFLPAEVAGYRRLMHGYQQLASRGYGSENHVEIARAAEALEQDFVASPPGILSRLLFPALMQVFQARARDEAARRAAAVLVAETKRRLSAGEAASIPSDPFAADGRPLVVNRAGGRLAVYSLGPDGEDDGGPPPHGEEAEDGNDDVGFVMAVP